MKIKSLTILLACLFSGLTWAQEIRVDSIRVIRLVRERPTHYFNGPHVTFYISIINNTDSIISLTPSHGKLSYKFNYNDREYQREIVDAIFLLWYIPSIILGKGEETSIALMELDYEIDEETGKPVSGEETVAETQLVFSWSIFSWTDILSVANNKKYYDFTKEMMCVLPTLQLVYEDPNYKFESRGIGKVIVLE